MPGKVNPVIPEVVSQVAFRIIGSDMTVTMAAEAGQLELNAFEPVIFYSIFEGIQALTNAIDEYHRNPSSATADNVAALYKAYNAQGAEQINAVKEVTKATDTSIAGIVSGNMKKHQDGVRRMEQMANAEANNNNIIAENERRIRELRTR